MSQNLSAHPKGGRSSYIRPVDAVRSIYPQAKTLLGYICMTAKCQPADVLLESDSVAFKEFCKTVLVVPASEALHVPISSDQQCSRSMNELLNKFIGNLLSRGNGPTSTSSFREQHCLTLGYRPRKYQSDTAMTSNPNVELFFVNTIHPFVTSQQWQLLFTRIGEPLIKNVLMRPVFMKCQDNGCYIQIAGNYPQMGGFKGGSSTNNINYNHTSRASAKSSNSSVNNHLTDIKENRLIYMMALAKAVEGSYSGAQLPRQRIFYNILRVPRANLASNHILNKAYDKISGTLHHHVTSDINNSSKNIRSIMNEVWGAAVTDMLFSSSCVGDDDRIRRRLRDQLQAVVETIVIQYHKCSFAKLLSLNCPLFVTVESAQKSSSSAAEKDDTENDYDDHSNNDDTGRNDDYNDNNAGANDDDDASDGTVAKKLKVIDERRGWPQPSCAASPLDNLYSGFSQIGDQHGGFTQAVKSQASIFGPFSPSQPRTPMVPPREAEAAADQKRNKRKKTKRGCRAGKNVQMRRNDKEHDQEELKQSSQSSRRPASSSQNHCYRRSSSVSAAAAAGAGASAVGGGTRIRIRTTYGLQPQKAATAAAGSRSLFFEGGGQSFSPEEESLILEANEDCLSIRIDATVAVAAEEDMGGVSINPLAIPLLAQYTDYGDIIDPLPGQINPLPSKKEVVKKNATVPTIPPKNPQSLGLKAQKERTSGGSIATIGQRLLQRMRVGASIDTAMQDCGYQSQDDTVYETVARSRLRDARVQMLRHKAKAKKAEEPPLVRRAPVALAVEAHEAPATRAAAAGVVVNTPIYSATSGAVGVAANHTLRPEATAAAAAAVQLTPMCYDEFPRHSQDEEKRNSDVYSAPSSASSSYSTPGFFYGSTSSSSQSPPPPPPLSSGDHADAGGLFQQRHEEQQLVVTAAATAAVAVAAASTTASSSASFYSEPSADLAAGLTMSEQSSFSSEPHTGTASSGESNFTANLHAQIHKGSGGGGGGGGGICGYALHVNQRPHPTYLSEPSAIEDYGYGSFDKGPANHSPAVGAVGGCQATTAAAAAAASPFRRTNPSRKRHREEFHRLAAAAAASNANTNNEGGRRRIIDGGRVDRGRGGGGRGNTNNNSSNSNKNSNPAVSSSDLRDLCCPTDRVCQFINAVCRGCFPLATVWGTRHNQSAFLAGMTRYVKLRRGETLTLSQVTPKIRVREIPWLMNTRNSSSSGSTNTGSSSGASNQGEEGRGSSSSSGDKCGSVGRKRQASGEAEESSKESAAEGSAEGSGSREESTALSRLSGALLNRLVYWIYESLINPTLSTYFYITEAEGRGAEVLYYRKPMWFRILQKAKDDMGDHFMQISTESLGGMNKSSSAKQGSISMSETSVSNGATTSIASSSSSSSSAAAAIPPLAVPTAAEVYGGASRSLQTLPNNLTLATSAAMGAGGRVSSGRPTGNTGGVASNGLKPASVRFIPKKSKLRPITNLRASRNQPWSYPSSSSSSTSPRFPTSASTSNNNVSTDALPNGGVTVTNSAMYNCLHILKHKYLARPALAGFGSFGIDELYEKLKEYRLRIYPRRGTDVKAHSIPKRINRGKRDQPQPPSWPPANRCDSDKQPPQSLPLSLSVNGGDASTSSKSEPMLAMSIDDVSGERSDVSGERSGSEPQSAMPVRFYVAALDLEKCYDNVDTALLYNHVRDLLYADSDDDEEDEEDNVDSNGAAGSAEGRRRGEKRKDDDDEEQEKGEKEEEEDDDERYLVHRYSVSHYIGSMERVATKTIRHVTAEGDIIPFKEASKAIAQQYRNSIITDGVVYPRMSRKEILRLLRIHLFSHVVKMPFSSNSSSKDGVDGEKRGGGSGAAGNIYAQVKGIPQGSILSPLLCNLYYGRAEREVFGSCEQVQLLRLSDASLIMRLMDDYLMISTERSAVCHFLQRAHQCLKPYGGGVNPTKTRVNFPVEMEVDGQRIQLQEIQNKDLHWCGQVLDTETLEVWPSFDRILERPLTSSVTVEAKRSAVVLRRAMKSYVRMKCHAMVLDAAVNSYPTVLRTVYRMFLLAAMRTHAYLKCMNRGAAGRNDKYLCRCIQEAVMFGARLIHSRTRRFSVRQLRMGSDAFSDSSNNNSSSAAAARSMTFSRCVLRHRALRRGGGGNTQQHSSSSSTAAAAAVAAECSVSHNQAIWLGLLAFKEVLGKRPGQYHSAIKYLRSRLLVAERSLDKDESLSSSSSSRRVSDYALIRECNELVDQARWM